jgi:hypothetical protein
MLQFPGHCRETSRAGSASPSADRGAVVERSIVSSTFSVKPFLVDPEKSYFSTGCRELIHPKEMLTQQTDFDSDACYKVPSPWKYASSQSAAAAKNDFSRVTSNAELFRALSPLLGSLPPLNRRGHPQ